MIIAFSRDDELLDYQNDFCDIRILILHTPVHDVVVYALILLSLMLIVWSLDEVSGDINLLHTFIPLLIAASIFVVKGSN